MPTLWQVLILGMDVMEQIPWEYFFFSLLAVLSLISASALFVKPRHVKIRFTKQPPVIVRVNAPSPRATDVQRTIYLPTGDKYVIPAGTKGHFVMVFDWKVPIRVDRSANTLVIPKLVATDFASIPRVLHSLLSPLNNSIYAAIVHDYLYRNPQAENARNIDKETADRIFYWGMRARGVGRFTAGLMYLGVWLGGGSSYKRC